MKIHKIIFIGSVFAILISCETKDANEKYFEDKKDKLEDFVDSVEAVVNRETNPNWTAMDMRYNSLTNDLRQAEDATSENERKGWRDLVERYEKAKTEGSRNTLSGESDFDSEALIHMNRVESRNITTNSNNQQIVDDTIDIREDEETMEESLVWLEENFDRLSADLKERFNKVKNGIQN